MHAHAHAHAHAHILLGEGKARAETCPRSYSVVGVREEVVQLVPCSFSIVEYRVQVQHAYAGSDNLGHCVGEYHSPMHGYTAWYFFLLFHSVPHCTLASFW